MSAYDCSISTVRLWDVYIVFYFGFLSSRDRELYGDVLLPIFEKHAVSHAGKQQIKDMWQILARKNMTEAGRYRKERIVNKLFHQESKTQLLLFLYIAVFPMLKGYVMLFQSRRPLVHRLHERQETLFTEFLSCFVKQDYLVKKSVTSLKTLNLEDPTKLLHKEDIYIGKAKSICSDSSTPRAIIRSFLENVLDAYVRCGKYLQKKLPLDNKLLRATSALDPNLNNSHIQLKLLKELKDLVPSVLSSEERENYDLEVHR